MREGGLSAGTGQILLGRRLEGVFIRLNKRIWEHLPARARELALVQSYGAWLHNLVCRSANREMYLGTHFLRNRPALELMRRLAQEKAPGSTFRIAVLGCSIGAEVYSILWTLRRSRPDLEFAVSGLDVSPEVVHFAEQGIYGPQASGMVDSSIFERLTAGEMQEMFDWHGDEGRIKPWLRERISWQVADASDPNLGALLGSQDLVVASNFLCHMNATDAESCLRNLADLAGSGGYVFVSGVDLDVRTRVACDLAWEPVSELRAEIHDGDPVMRADWPWQWWGLEPLDRTKPDWQIRYTAVFQVGRCAARVVRR